MKREDSEHKRDIIVIPKKQSEKKTEENKKIKGLL